MLNSSSQFLLLIVTIRQVLFGHPVFVIVLFQLFLSLTPGPLFTPESGFSADLFAFSKKTVYEHMRRLTLEMCSDSKN